MKKLFFLSLISSSFLIGSNSIKADEAFVFNLSSEGYGGVNTYEFFKTVRSGNSFTLEKITTLSASGISLDPDASAYEQSTGEFWMYDETSAIYKIYNIASDSWSNGTFSSQSLDSTPNYYGIDSISKKSGITSNASNISTNTSNISSNDTDIASNSTNISSNDTDISTNTSNS